MSSSSTKLLVAEVISTWRAGERPDTAAVLSRHPQLRQEQNVLLDLAYEEYCLRKEAGETLSPESFCDRFPSCRRSLGRLLAIHECASEDASLAQDLEGDDAAWPAVGSTFLGFQLLQELGRGAFAHVYLARQPALGNRLVVVKVAQYGSAEAETLGRLAHRNIVPIHSVGEDPATHMTAVCMPYLGSATLLDVLDAGYQDNRPPLRARFIHQIAREAAIPQVVPEMYTGTDPYLQHGTYVDGIVHLAVQLAEALQHTHKAGICHRDLKPSNVLLTPSGCPMLMDFNLSIDVQLERTFVGGTLPYMSPEQLRGMTSDVAIQDAEGDPRSDLFSLGIILYELLTGHLPFGDRAPGALADDAARQLLAKQETGCKSVRRDNPYVNRALARIVHQCLAIDPDARPASGQELADSLRRQLRSPAKMMRWARRRWFLASGGVVAMGLASAIAAVHASSLAPYEVRHYEAGIRAFHAEDWAAAIDHFSRAAAARPDAYEPRFALGQTRIAAGDYAQAVEDLKAAYDLNPRGSTAAWLGYAYDCLGLFFNAEVHYGEAIAAYDQNYASLWNNRGDNARRRTSLAAAIDHLTQAIELDPGCQAAYYSRALTYARCDDNLPSTGGPYSLLAVQDIERALELGPVDDEMRKHAETIRQQRKNVESGLPRSPLTSHRELRLPLANRFPPLFEKR